MKTRFLFCAPILAASFALIANAQVTCTVSSVPNLSRLDGRSELLSDLHVTCTGGTPTAANSVVPQMNIVVFLNTVLTSRITEASVQFDEVLMLVDEPNASGAAAPVPLLNCGNTGAPDSSPSGPGVCSIVSTGVPTQTYDGSQNTYGTSTCTAGGVHPLGAPGCGRPNVFQ